MYHCYIFTNDPIIQTECSSIINQVNEIEIRIIQYINDIDWNNGFSNCLFILITEINKDILDMIHYVQNNIPDLSIIFYNHSLVLSNLEALSDTPRMNLIIGANRKVILHDQVRNLKENYWRKIPYEQLQIPFDKLSSRLQKAFRFIESSDISDCNINTIANYLDISPGYFSQEFKRETGQSFRQFMQQLLNYYENIILKRVNLSTKSISKLLGYSELSSFSRSFKNRKGVSPSEYKKLAQL